MKNPKESPVHVTTHTGKLEGIPSVSTSCLCNRMCMARAKDPRLICSKCYSVSLQMKRTNLANAMKQNYEVLTKPVADGDLPRFTAKYVRIESFGDVANQVQAENYIRMVRLSPRTRFAAWTKNLAIWIAAFKRVGKPANMTLVYSDPVIGGSVKPGELVGGEWVDHVFAVLPKNTPDERINCGGRHCLSCLRCYRKNTARMVYEKLKSI